MWSWVNKEKNPLRDARFAKQNFQLTMSCFSLNKTISLNECEYVCRDIFFLLTSQSIHPNSTWVISNAQRFLDIFLRYIYHGFPVDWKRIMVFFCRNCIHSDHENYSKCQIQRKNLFIPFIQTKNISIVNQYLIWFKNQTYFVQKTYNETQFRWNVRHFSVIMVVVGSLFVAYNIDSS